MAISKIHDHIRGAMEKMKWSHLEDLYKNNRGETGLVMIPKLKYEHIYLTKFSKMRVDLAAQVSNDVDIR